MEAADGSQGAPVPANAMGDDDDEPMITGEMDLDESLAVRLQLLKVCCSRVLKAASPECKAARGSGKMGAANGYCSLLAAHCLPLL